MLRSSWEDVLLAVMAPRAGKTTALADHFIQEIRGVGSSDPFWPPAGDLLTSLFLAAANSGGTLADVQAWLSDVTSREPVTLLRAAGFGQTYLANSVDLGRRPAPTARPGNL